MLDLKTGRDATPTDRNEEEIGEKFVSALIAQDFAALQECFAPEVRFRALVPKGVREAATAEEAAAWLRKWFGDSDQMELQASRAETVQDRLHISYKLHEHEAGEWFLIEQQAYCTVSDGLITDMALLCSGFRPTGENGD